MNKIQVLVVDDHPIVREGICALLAVVGDVEVVAEAANGNEAIDMVRELQPDVVLMDIAMPIMGGLEATHRINKEFPKTKVLVLTQYDDKEYVFPVIESGASGFISKAASRYNPIAGKNPATHKRIRAITRVQKTEKSKCSASPLHTPKIMPLRER